MSRRPSFVRRFLGHRAGVLGAIVVAAFVAAGLLAPLVAPYDPNAADPLLRLRGPSPEHWLGMDPIGRDVLSRILHGATLSMRVGITVVFMGTVIGVPIGALSGYIGGAFDLLLQRVIDTLQAFPGILLIVLVVALLGPSLDLATLALGFLSVPAYARLVRGSVLMVRELMFVEAARSVGCGDLRLLARHILPNSLTPVIVQSSLQSASALLLVAGLSFLGLGAQPPTPEWGSMLAEGRTVMRAAPHVVIFPALAVSLVVLGLNMVGDALRDALDTRAVYGVVR